MNEICINLVAVSESSLQARVKGNDLELSTLLLSAMRYDEDFARVVVGTATLYLDEKDIGPLGLLTIIEDLRNKFENDKKKPGGS
jgi:hypothetical protein